MADRQADLRKPVSKPAKKKKKKVAKKKKKKKVVSPRKRRSPSPVEDYNDYFEGGYRSRQQRGSMGSHNHGGSSGSRF